MPAMNRLHRVVAAATLALAALGAAAQAQPAAPVLDPARLMLGFPPPPEYRIHVGNWQRWPQKIWSFQNTRELFPTRPLAPRGPVWALPEARRDLDGLQVGTTEAPTTWPQMLAATHTDAVLVLHQGRIVEQGDPDTLFRHPQHPYTQRLLAAVPGSPYRMQEGPMP